VVSVRRRLLIALPVVVAVSSALLAVLLVTALRDRPLWNEEGSLREMTENLALDILEDARNDPSARYEPERAVRAAVEKRYAAEPETSGLELRSLKVTVTGDSGRIIFDREGSIYQTLLLGDEESTVITVSTPLLLLGSPAGKLFLSKGREGAAGATPGRERTIITGVAAAGAALLLAALVSVLWATRSLSALVRYAAETGEGGDVHPPDLEGDELEGVMRRLEEAKESVDGTQYVEKYVQTLTHEMKSPLSVLRGASELLEEEMSDEQRDLFLGNIRKETERIQDLVDRLLQLSSIEGRRELRDVEQIVLAPLVREVVDGAEPLLAGRQIVPDVDLDRSAAVWGERFLLRQALANVIKNAVEFSPTGGALALRLKTEEGRAVITVDDAGPGVPDYALDRIFEKFYSLGRPDTGRRSSGLGLPFARETVHLHGGGITVENMAGGGVRVRITLPLEPPSTT
jgi:two-component system sensor histidine kinase CreC